jgi:hypothetical protein
MPDPYARLDRSIPVTVLTAPIAGTLAEGMAVIRMEPSRHDHAAGVECVACAAQADIRALLFDLLEAWRQGRRPPFNRVLVDASALPDAEEVIDRLVPGRLPALGLRDHAVARNFHLDSEPGAVETGVSR